MLISNKSNINLYITDMGYRNDNKVKSNFTKISIGLASPTDVKPSKYFKQTIANGIVMYASMMVNSYSKYADIDYSDFDF